MAANRIQRFISVIGDPTKAQEAVVYRFDKPPDNEALVEGGSFDRSPNPVERLNRVVKPASFAENLPPSAGMAKLFRG